MNRGLRAIVVGIGVVAGMMPRAEADPGKKRGPGDKVSDKKPPPEPPTPAPRPTPAEPPAERPPAEARRMVGILDVRVVGVPDEAKLEFERGLEDQLDTNMYWLSSRAQMRDRLKFSTKWTEGCLVGACLGEVRTQTTADLVLLVALSGAGTSFGYVVTLVRTDNGRPLAQESGRCDVCTGKESMLEATLATLKLLNNVPDKLPDEAGDHGAAIDLAVGKMHRTLGAQTAKHRRQAITLLVVGLVVAGAGVGAYFVQDEHAPAFAIMGVGGGLALGGVTLLAF